MCQQQLGFISHKYESGKLGCAAIGNLNGDPGGASYGAYQLAAGVGTLQAYLKESKYYTTFAGLKPGSLSFNEKWRSMAKDTAFCQSQHAFIKKTHFDPVLKYWVGHHGLESNCVIDEALFSMSVQHSYKGCVKIMDAAEQYIQSDYDDHDAVSALYKARNNYITRLTLPDNIKKALHNRYRAEMADVLNITIQD